MKRALLSALGRVDQRLAAIVLACKRERPALITFIVHTLFESEREAHSGTADPFHPVVFRDLERMVEYFLGCGYRFVTPAEIVAGLDPAGHYVWLTFDDGYATNLRALPLLRERGIPATFFVSTTHIADGKAHWWDAVYRERRRRGAGEAAIRSEQQALKLRPHREIEAYVRNEFGHSALDPVADADRPMTAAELKSLASTPLATLGNHTADHALLTLYDDGAVRAQIRSCQDYLAAATGAVPEAIAYPGGCFDERVTRLARAEGLRLGAATARGKNRLPLTGGAAMGISRFALSPGPGLIDQYLLCRSDFSVVSVLGRWRARFG